MNFLDQWFTTIVGNQYGDRILTLVCRLRLHSADGPADSTWRAHFYAPAAPPDIAAAPPVYVLPAAGGWRDPPRVADFYGLSFGELAAIADTCVQFQYRPRCANVEAFDIRFGAARAPLSAAVARVGWVPRMAGIRVYAFAPRPDVCGGAALTCVCIPAGE